MRVGVLGPLVVQLGDGDRSVPGQRQRDLLTALLLPAGNPRAARGIAKPVVAQRERADDSHGPAPAVARLRRLCGSSSVERLQAGYLMGRSTGTDADTFADLVQSARRARRQGDWPAAGDLYRRALDCWRGPQPFVDVSAHLVDADRTRLIELQITAQLELAELLLDQAEVGDAQEAGALADAAIRQEPLREHAHELAMLAAYRDGRQAAALQVYRELRRMLCTELGIEPGPSIRALHTLILRQDPAVSAHLAQSANRQAGNPVMVVRARPAT